MKSQNRIFRFKGYFCKKNEIPCHMRLIVFVKIFRLLGTPLFSLFYQSHSQEAILFLRYFEIKKSVKKTSELQSKCHLKMKSHMETKK